MFRGIRSTILCRVDSSAAKLIHSIENYYITVFFTSIIHLTDNPINP